LLDSLESLNAPEDVINWFADFPDGPIKGKTFAEFRKNPNLSVDELFNIAQNIEQETQQKEQAKQQNIERQFPDSVVFAMSCVSNDNLKLWVKSIAYKKFGNDFSSYDQDVLRANLLLIEEWVNSIDKEELSNFQLQNYGFEDLVEQIKKFKQDQIEASGRDKLGFKEIMYGPEWSEQNLNGFVIVELNEKPQLVYESEILNHCVGRSDHYINEVKENKSRLFSLRHMRYV